MQLLKWIVIFVIFRTTFSTELPMYCTSTRVPNLNFSLILAMPIFASNPMLAKDEENSSYLIQVIDKRVSVSRQFEYSKDCVEYQRNIFHIEERYVDRFRESVGKNSCNSSAPIPWIPLTSFYISIDQNIAVLIACNETEVNVTVIANCNKLDSGVSNLERDVIYLLLQNKIPVFPLVQVDFENRFNSFMENPPRSPNPLIHFFKLCSRQKFKRQSQYVVLLYLLLLIAMSIVAYYVFIQKKKIRLIYPLIH